LLPLPALPAVGNLDLPVIPSSDALLDTEPPADEEFVTWEPLRSWEGSIELGLNGTEGNSEAFNLRFGGKLKRHTPVSEQTYEFNYVDQSSNGVKSARNGLFDGRIKWPFNDSPWSWFFHTGLEYDEFKPFDLRLSFDTGLGYDFIRNDVTTLTGRVGGGASKEINGISDDWVPEMLWALDLERKLSERQKMSASVEYLPDVTDFEEYRLNAKASWEVVIDPDWGLSLKLSAINRYDSTPDGAKPNDIDYAALFLWSF